MSLRDLPPQQKVSARRFRRLRFVPLIALVVTVAISAVIGGLFQHRFSAEAAITNAPAPITSRTASSVLPAICHPSVPSPPQEPWLGSSSDRAAAEAIWQSHSADLSHEYVIEKDGFVDWGDIQAANFSQAVGRRNLSVAEVSKWHDYLADLDKQLTAQGIPLFVVVTPAKWDVYPQELPDWAQAIRGSGPLDQLLAASPDLPIVDLRAQLRTASADHQTYSKTNSHWSSYGGYVGWQATSACLRAADPEFAAVKAPAIDGVSISADANEFAPFGIPDPAPNWTSPIYSDPLHPVTVTQKNGSPNVQDGVTPTDLSVLPATTSTADPQTALTALFVRDSYGNSLSVPLQQSFATTWQVRHNFDGPADTQPDIPALARADHPSVVILQIAERHLNFPPQG